MDDTIKEEGQHTNLRYGKTVTKEDFLRQTFINLSADRNTPIDILSSQFAEVTDSEQQLLLVGAHVKVDVTCQVGNDRTEEYLSTEKYRENGVEKERIVKKTRTVTDWAPLAFSRDEDRSAIVLNQDEDVCYIDNDRKYFGILKDCKKDSVKSISDTYIEQNDAAIARAKKLCMSKSVDDGIPSKKSKDVSVSGTAKVIGINGLIVPEYNLKYKYNGKEYTANGPACGLGDSDVHICPHDEESVDKTANKKALPFLLGGVAAVLLGLILAIVQVPVVVATLIMMAGVGFIVAYFIAKKKFCVKIKNDRQQVKKKKLIDALSKRGLAPLTASENSLFDKRTY